MRDRLRQEEGGWTLIELLVAMAIFTFVLGAALTLFETSVKSAPKELERAAAVTEAQTGLSGMVREIRDANEIFFLGPNLIDFVVLRKGVEVHVRYECGLDDPDSSDPNLYACRRSEGTVPSPPAVLGTPRTVIARMQQVPNPAGEPVFTYTMPPMEPLDLEDEPLDYPEAVPCVPPTTVLCLPAPWPTFIDVNIRVPARGSLAKSAYTHSISFSGAAYLRNLEAGQSPYNSGG